MLFDKLKVYTNNKASLKIQVFWGGISYRLVKLQTIRRNMLPPHLQDLAAKQNSDSLNCYTLKTEANSVSAHQLYDVVMENKSIDIFIII